MTPAAEKRALRLRVRSLRAAIRSSERDAAGEAVAARVLVAPEYASAARVAAYAAIGDELPTAALLRSVLASGRTLLLPRVMPDRSLHFAAVTDLASLRPARLGIPEPPADAPVEALGADVLVLVPGLAFDFRGQRLGYGAGCYDRALRGAGCPVFGLAFDLQLLDRVPGEAHDRRVDAVVTERRLHRVPGTPDPDRAAEERRVPG